MPTSALRCLALLLCVFALACGDTEEYARFDVDNGADVPDCVADTFPFEPTFLSAKTHQGRTGIFLQSPRDVKYRSDMALIQLYDTDIPDDGRIELATEARIEAQARAKMAFFSSCPREMETLELRGTIELEHFHSVDGLITGRLVDGYAVDARTEETMIESLTGSWHLQARRGVPHQDFFALPESEVH